MAPVLTLTKHEMIFEPPSRTPSCTLHTSTMECLISLGTNAASCYRADPRTLLMRDFITPSGKSLRIRMLLTMVVGSLTCFSLISVSVVCHVTGIAAKSVIHARIEIFFGVVMMVCPSSFTSDSRRLTLHAREVWLMPSMRLGVTSAIATDACFASRANTLARSSFFHQIDSCLLGALPLVADRLPPFLRNELVDLLSPLTCLVGSRCCGGVHFCKNPLLKGLS